MKEPKVYERHSWWRWLRGVEDKILESITPIDITKRPEWMREEL